ncbi:hypothetical protein AMS68_006031 [Peltaster fructicola]|uniref:Apple domain-containing protein n=1 Tax=Peltaster fructicola TaxID=286661 RepID=A0A6H0Y0I1_9PEZI|nr:hypothetical protein AMS68_006031 [Peltaster fructicola]
MNGSLRSGRVIALVVTLCVVAALVFYQTPHTLSTSPWSRPPPPPPQQHAPGADVRPPLPPDHVVDHLPPEHKADAESSLKCTLFPDTGKLAIAVKTGATEAVERIPILMLTTLQCAKNVMIFSDLEQDIAGHHLHDALADIPESAMQDNTDFDFYRHLKEADKLGEIEQMLRGAKDPRMPGDLAAWTLDKYKQLHILEKMYAKYPDKAWYMMVDADTYVVWPNVLTWLDKLPDPFANKLSGIFISHAAMHEFAGTGEHLAAKWDKPMHDECCGDYVIGLELKNHGIPLKPSWPTVNGEKPVTLPFGPTHWCEPVVTMHHVAPNEMSQLSNYELSRNDTSSPMTFADLFRAFTGNVVPDSLPDWDNYSQDKQVDAESYAACQQLCEDDKKCFQFAHQGKECRLGYSIHLGEPRASDQSMKRQSGWLKQRIETWVQSRGPCEPKFPWTK